MVGRTFSDSELESIARLVTALADESFATAPWAGKLATCGLAIDALPDGGSDGSVRFADVERGLDGSGTVVDGHLTSASLFVAESRPPDRRALRQVSDALGRFLSAQWGLPELDPSSGAPRSTWRVGGLDVSLDCYWDNGAIGLLMICVEPSTRATLVEP